MKIFTLFLLLRKTLRQRRIKPVFSFLLFTLLYIPVSAQTVNIKIDPASTTVTAGGSFAVDVNYDFIAAGSVDVAEVHLTFDNTKLQVVSIIKARPEFGTEAIPLEPIATINANGQINYNAGTSVPANIATADFDFLTITFNVIGGSGTTTPLTLLETFPPTDALSAGSSVKNIVINGTVSINAVSCTTPTATISVQPGPPTCDAQAFNLVLESSSAGTTPFDLTINGTTYDNIPVGGVITNFVPPTERIWPTAPVPSTFDDAPQNLTLGVSFQSSVSGFVKGVRFFSPNDGPAADGTFTGQLWTAGGVLLASAPFTGVALDGWNELSFTEPILISAATTYVASYHTNSTFYASTPGGLAAPVLLGSLTALANSGVYVYGAAVTFPDNATPNNYWADVIFSPNVYAFNLTGVKDLLECSNTGALQTLNVTSIDCSTLPVSLINFSATPKDNAVLLRWATASEFNNLGFEVQRSIDGNNSWTAIGFVNGAGNSNSLVNYSYVDENLSASRYYYRLKQIDIDQRFAYSPIVSVQLDGKQAFDLQQNYPNPFRGETIIRFTLPQKTNINLSIFDMNGRLVKVLANGSKDSGTHAVTLNSGILTSGLYYYKLQTGDFSAVKKLTIR